MVDVSENWRSTYPGAVMGILVMRGVTNPERHEGLEAEKAALEGELRSRFASAPRQILSEEPVVAAYDAYYRGFKKSYHVRLQLESLVWKGRSIPSVSALVEAMFMAELSHMILTAGHDLDELVAPLRVDVAAGGESFTTIGGEERLLKEGDMMMSDGKGVISSVIHGPDRRTRISSGTKNALFAVYAPSGVGETRVRTHLQSIERFVRIVCPEARTETLETL